MYTAQRDSALNVLRNRSNVNQIKEYMLQRAVTQQYNLAFTGGTDNSSYYISGNYTKDQPIYKSNKATSYNLNANFKNDFLRKRLTLNTGIVYGCQSAQVNNVALQTLGVGTFGSAPYDQLVDDNGNKVYTGSTYTERVSDSLARTKNLLPYTYNAIDELDYNHTITNKNNIRLNASLKGVLTNWLNVTVSGQYQKTILDQVNNKNLNSYLTRDLINNSTNTANITNTSFLRINAVPKGGVYRTSRGLSDDYGLRGQLNADKNFGEDHHFDAILGTEIREAKYEGSEQALYGYDEQRSTSVPVSTVVHYATLTNSRSRLPNLGMLFKSRTRYLSYYGNGTYSYLNRYFVSGSFRFDDINILGVDRRDRARPLWSSGLRWDIKREVFLQDVNWISSLSIRGTIGTTPPPIIVK